MDYKNNKTLLEDLIKESNTLTEVLLKLKIRAAGSNYKTLKKYIKIYEIDISHFDSAKVILDKLKNTNLNKKTPIELILVFNSTFTSTSHLKERLYKEGFKTRKCEMCGQDENWNGNRMSLILDHINGIHNDNRLENLRIVCPNCNATLDTHCGKNNKKRKPVNNSDLFLTDKRIQNFIKKRKVIRPDYETLKEEVSKNGFLPTGKKYKVSDNAIRRWLKNYEKNNF